MKAALENRITGGFLSHILLICGVAEMAIANAKKHCVSVSVCGEAAADTESAKMYVYIGIRNLSMAPNAVLNVKSRLIEEFE